jgi:hypothetical protein
MVAGVHERAGMCRHNSRVRGDADCAMSFGVRERESVCVCMHGCVCGCVCVCVCVCV